MDAPDLPRIPLTNRAARRSLKWRLAWSAVGACLLSVLTLSVADRLFPAAVGGFARTPVRAPERPATAPDRLPAARPGPEPEAAAPERLAAPRPGKRHKRKDGGAEKKPEALVTFEEPPKAPAAAEASGRAASKPYLTLVNWIKSVGGGGTLGNRFLTFHQKQGAPSSGFADPATRGGGGGGGGRDASRATAPLLGGGAPDDIGAVSPGPAAAGLRDRPVPLEWGEATGAPVLVKKARNPDAQGFWAPDITRGSEVSPDELRQIRAEDKRIQERLELEIWALRVGGGSVIVVLWVALLLFASGAAQRFSRPWGEEVAESDVTTKAGKRR